MGTTLVSIQTTDAGETLVRRYDAAFPDGPTHEGSWSKGIQVTPAMVERMRLDPWPECAVEYEAEQPSVA